MEDYLYVILKQTVYYPLNINHIIIL